MTESKYFLVTTQTKAVDKKKKLATQVVVCESHFTGTRIYKAPSEFDVIGFLLCSGEEILFMEEVSEETYESLAALGNHITAEISIPD